MLQLRYGSQQYGPRSKVYHLMDLLDRAYGEAPKLRHQMKFSRIDLRNCSSASLAPTASLTRALYLQTMTSTARQPKLICSPASPGTVRRHIAVSAQGQATVAPWGGGTAMGFGNPPR